MWNQVWNILNELSPWLLLGAVVAGLMHLLVPAERLQRLLQGRGSLLASVLVGIPLPLCSCSVIPVGIGLRKAGASRGASVGFLVSTPQTGVDSIFVSGSLLGWPFALFKVAAALVMGVVGGGLAERFGRDPGTTADEDRPVTQSVSGRPPFRARVLESVLHAVELIRSIWRWLVIGVLVSAAISWLLPADQFSRLSSASGPLALLVTLLISLPLYVCATASVPIAAALVSSGLPAGAAIVFLMAGPATNLATLGAVHRTFGRRTTALYLITMVGGSLVAGLLFDSLLSTQSVAGTHEHHQTDWFSAFCTALLLSLLAFFAWEEFRRWYKGPAVAGDLTLHIVGMHCENCASGLERDFKSVAGVDDAVVRFSTEEAIIRGKPKLDDLMQVLSVKGFTAEQL